MVEQLVPEFVQSRRPGDLGAVVSPPPAKKFAIAVFSAIGVLVIIAGGLVWARAVFYSPEAAINGYISALQNRDAVAALTHLDPSRGDLNDTLLEPEVIRDPGYTPPTDFLITSVDSDGDIATVTAAMRLGSQTASTAFTLERDNALPWRLFRPWRVVDGLGGITVNWPFAGGITVAGKSVGRSTEDYSLAFPGAYQAVAGASALVEAPPISIVVEAGHAAFGQFAPTIKASAADAVKTQVADYLDKCSKQTTLQPSGCPFSAYNSSYGTPTNVVWSISPTPTYVVGINGSNLSVTTKANGTAGVTWQGTDYRNFPVPDSDSASFRVDGVVREQGGQPVYSPGS
jgi:hypothetical protein